MISRERPSEAVGRSCDDQRNMANSAASSRVVESTFAVPSTRPQLVASVRGLTPVAQGNRREGRLGRSGCGSRLGGRDGCLHGYPPLPTGPRLPSAAPQKRRRPAYGPVSPVAPRRTAVAAVVRPADLSLPRAVLHVSGVSYCHRLLPEAGKCKRLRPSRGRWCRSQGGQGRPFRAIRNRACGLLSVRLSPLGFPTLVG